MAKLVLRINIFALIIALFICLVNVALAQYQSFITSVNPQDISSSSEMDAYIGRLKKHPDLAAYHFVRLNPLASSQKDGILQLDIPGRSRPVRAEASHVEYFSDTKYEWIGKTDEDRGTVIVISKRGAVSAHISTLEGVYEIFPAPGGMHCLHVIDPRTADDVGCAMTSSGEKDHANERMAADQPLSAGNQNAKLYPCQQPMNPRVLVLYSPHTLEFAGGLTEITNRVNLGISQFNSCIYNSNLPSAAALQLAGIAPIAFVESDYIEPDRNKLIGSATAKNLRNQYKADVVVLLATKGYSGGNTRGMSGTTSLTSDSSYAVVDFWSTTAMKTFAHEVGHLFGCRHENTGGIPAYAQGYVLKSLGITTDRTIMCSKNLDDDQAANRLLNFSNPNVSVGGKATGTNLENNALRVSQSQPTVSGFRPEPPPQLVAYVDGPTYITAPGQKSYEVSYSCGSGSYNIVWHYSYDGVNYTASNTTTDIFTWPFYQNQKIWLRATVTSGGQSVSAFIAITAQMPSPYKSAANAATTENETADFIVSPNPTSGIIQIKYLLAAKEKVSIELLDHSGAVLTQIMKTSTQSKGWQSLEWNGEKIPTGTYIIRINRIGTSTTQQIMIVR